MSSIVTRWTAAAFMIGAVVFGLLGCAAWAIQQDKINQLQQERNELLNKLEATLTLQQCIAIDTKAQEIIPSMSAEVSFAFSTEFKGKLVDIQSERLKVLIFDAEGKDIEKIFALKIIRVKNLAEGVYVITLDARSLPRGVYVLVISAEYFVEISQIPRVQKPVNGSAVVTILRE